MSFHNTAPCFLIFYHSNQSLLLFKFVLNATSLLTLYITLCSWYDYTWLQYGRAILSTYGST